MNWAYIVRFPNDGGPLARIYAIKYVDHVHFDTAVSADHKPYCPIDQATPPVLRRKSGGHSEWDYSNEPIGARMFHRAYPCIRLKPGEGPILVDLDDVSTKRTSRDPDDTPTSKG